MNNNSLSEQEQVRRNALEQLQKIGINPYPADEFKITHRSTKIKNSFTENQKVSIAGRIMSRRIMGKASFAELKDSKGRIQVYITRDDISPDADKMLYNTVFKKYLDIGDIIGVKGFVFKTKVGEITVHAKELTVLSKSLRPLPIVKQKDSRVYDAFSDPELRYRQRYVDLIVNEESKNTFIKRTELINSIRSFLNEHQFLEVETPVLQAIHGGALAKPFKTHHNALNTPLYLRIANELYLKRLIVGGFDRVYEFSKDFRNEGMDKLHNPEFTMLEFYVAYKDYKWMMSFTEKMLENTAINLFRKTHFRVNNNIINLKSPYKRISLLDAIKEYTGYDLYGKTEQEILATVKKLNIDTKNIIGKGKLIDEIFSAYCEKQFIQPTFVMDYPIEMSPLSKNHREKERLTERFELFINGQEIANAYSELNDPIDQLKRFQQQLTLNKKGDDEAMVIDYDFVRALEYGMPPTAGIGFGIDRLIMLLTGHTSIQEVIFFPQMRPEKIQVSNINDFIALGISECWAAHVKNVYTTTQTLKNEKITQIYQKLNSFRKKNGLELPALQLSDIESWKL